MDAIKFMTEHQRMCTTYDGCLDCPLSSGLGKCIYWPSLQNQELYPRIIKAVEDWSSAHPATTRADLFKKSYPHSPTDDYGALLICPLNVGETITCTSEVSCPDCRKKYWLKEAQNGR